MIVFNIHHSLDTKFVELVKKLNFIFDKCAVAKSESVKLIIRFKLFNKKVILPAFAYFLYLQMYFWVGTLHGWTGPLRRKVGRKKVLAGLAPSSKTVRSLMRTPCPAKPFVKIYQKVISVNSLE
jgi:hypothetical protein